MNVEKVIEHCARYGYSLAQLRQTACEILSVQQPLAVRKATEKTLQSINQLIPAEPLYSEVNQ